MNNIKFIMNNTVMLLISLIFIFKKVLINKKDSSIIIILDNVLITKIFRVYPSISLINFINNNPGIININGMVKKTLKINV